MSEVKIINKKLETIKTLKRTAELSILMLKAMGKSLEAELEKLI